MMSVSDEIDAYEIIRSAIGEGEEDGLKDIHVEALPRNAHRYVVMGIMCLDAAYRHHGGPNAETVNEAARRGEFSDRYDIEEHPDEALPFFDSVAFSHEEYGLVKSALEEYIHLLGESGMGVELAREDREAILSSSEVQIDAKHEAGETLYDALYLYDDRHGADLLTNLPSAQTQFLKPHTIQKCVCGSWSGRPVKNCPDCGYAFEGGDA